MTIAIYSAIFLAALVALSLVGRMIRKKSGDDNLRPLPPTRERASEAAMSASPLPSGEGGGRGSTSDDDDECCGEHEVCEKGKIKRALRTDIEYFDDEELDRYRGTAPDEYDDEAVEEFREVLYTMYPSEVEDWLKSLELRGVALPDPLKDEVFMLLGR